MEETTNTACRIIGRCSFCQVDGHNITKCNDQRIFEFIDELIRCFKQDPQELPVILPSIEHRLRNAEKFLIDCILISKMRITRLHISSLSLKDIDVLFSQYIANVCVNHDGNAASNETKYNYNVSFTKEQYELINATMRSLAHSARNREKHKVQFFTRILVDNLSSCPVCLTSNVDAKNVSITNCNHSFCTSCIKHWIFSHNCDESDYAQCPYCRADLKYVFTNLEKEPHKHLKRTMIFFNDDQVIKGHRKQLRVQHS